MNPFIKSSKTFRLDTFRSRRDSGPFEKMTQFFARGSPFDIQTAEREFRLHHTKNTDLTKTLEVLQQQRTEINRMLSFFQQIRFVDRDYVFTLKAIDSRSDFVLEIDTNKFVQCLQQPTRTITNYFFWGMVAIPIIAALLSPGSGADCDRSVALGLTAASRSDACRSE